MHFDDRPIIGRLINTRTGKIFLCCDGTIAEVNEALLAMLLFNFQSMSSYSGCAGRWNYHTNNMMDVPGVTLACVFTDRLIVLDGTPFTRLFPGVNSEEYITATKYAEKHEKSVTQIKRLCREKRISGCVKIGGQWLIPESAKYPEDGRKLKKVF